MKDLKKLASQLKRIEELVGSKELVKTTVSRASVGWHLEHSLLTLNKVYTAISHSDPSRYNPSFNLNRFLILGSGFIPRNRGKAPDSVRPKRESTTEDIIQAIALARRNIDLIPALASGSYFHHPYFGDLNIDQTIRFLRIHTAHHLKIVDDIIRK